MPPRALFPVVAVVAATLLGAKGHPPVGVTETTLAADDACSAGAGSGCAVSALQKRLLADRVETDEALEEPVRSSSPVLDDRAPSFMQSVQGATLDKYDPYWELQIAATRISALASKAKGKELLWITPDDPNATIKPTQRLMAKACKRLLQGKKIIGFNASCLMSATWPPQLNIDEGMYDLLFEALRKYEHDDDQQYLQQYLWRALSDQTLTELGAQHIANSGGPNNGILYMAQQLTTKPPYYAYCSDKLTLAYEIAMCMQGLLMFDTDGTRTQTVIQAGVVPKLVKMMEMEPDLIATHSSACKAMAWIMRRNPDSVALFKEAGALPRIEDAMVRFKDGDASPFFFDKTLGDAYPISDCDLAKYHLKGDRAKYDEAWNANMANMLKYKPYLKLSFPPPEGF